MDQWTSKSIHLLTDLPRPLLNSSGYVTDANTGVHYEDFCSAIEKLALELKISPQSAEEKIFSIGGRRPGHWRRYVRQNWVYIDQSLN